MRANLFVIAVEISINILTTTTMKEKIEKILNENTTDREKRTKLMFFLCFNLLEDDSKQSSGELRKMVYDALDVLGIQE